MEEATAPAEIAEPAMTGAALAVEAMVSGSATAMAATAIPLVKLVI